MYCPNCGTQNADGSRFCQSCGASLAAATGTSAYAPARPATPSAPSVSGWRTTGWIGVAGAAVALLGFFLPYLTVGTALTGVFSGSGTFGGDISGWSMFFYTITGIVPALFDSRTGGLGGLSFLPGGYALLLILLIVDLIALALVPLAGISIGVNGYRLAEGSGSSDNRQRLRRMRGQAIWGLVPVIGLFLLIQGVLGFSFGGSLESFGGGSLSLGLNLMGTGFWLTVIGFAVVIFAGPLAAPRDT